MSGRIEGQVIHRDNGCTYVCRPDQARTRVFPKWFCPKCNRYILPDGTKHWFVPIPSLHQRRISLVSLAAFCIRDKRTPKLIKKELIKTLKGIAKDVRSTDKKK